MADIGRPPLIFAAQTWKRRCEGFVDPPNLLLTTLSLFATLQAIPVGGQLSDSIPQKLPYLSKTDPVPNLLAGLFDTVASPALPVGKQLFESAPPKGARPVFTYLAAQPIFQGIVGVLPFVQETYHTLPTLKYQPQVDVIPNLLNQQLFPPAENPFTPVNFLPAPQMSRWDTATIFVPIYQPPAAPTSPPFAPSFLSEVPKRKIQVFVEQKNAPDTLIRPPVIPLVQPVAQNYDFSQLQRKFNVYDVNSLWPRAKPLDLPVVPPKPFIQQLDVSRRQRKYEVYDSNDLWPNSQLPNSIVASITPVVPSTHGHGHTRFGGFVLLEPKKQGEVAPVSADFISRLGNSETITGAVVTISVYSGVDAAPAAMLLGGPSISGTEIIQEVRAGVTGVVYLVVFKAITNQANTLEITGYLAVTPDYP